MGIVNLPKRHSIRLFEYDYSQQGLYFVTICTKDRACLFGEIDDDKIVLNEIGDIVKKCWFEIPQHFPHVQLHEFIIMPNHIHDIIEIVNDIVGVPLVGTRDIPTDGQPQGIAPTKQNNKSLGDIIGSFKSKTTNSYINGVKQNNWPAFNGKLWQRNYYEHIIRNDDSYQKITEYIHENPKYWQTDDYYISK